ncbi:hypothetical protein C0J52_02160 [Blattella germanica]|nr:hypothetical protein C0J52_02160 [Blattella germanica]
MMTTTSTPSTLTTSDHGIGNFGEHSFWSASSCDKETVRLETAILEDLNKYCWTQDSAEAPSQNSNGGPCHKVSITNSNPNNTDGAIYTLTVLNGGDHSGTWYRTPESAPTLKDDEENQQSLSSPHNLSSHPTQNHTSALDLDSILSIIPNQPTTTTTPTTNGHQFHQNGYHQTHPHPSNHLHQPNDTVSTLSPHHHTINQDGLVKSEQQYAYDDSGFANKDCMNHIVDGSSLIPQETNSPDANTSFNNNNNDWKLANNNTNSATADSLLRSALQGKSFLGRYNGTCPKNGKAMEGHIELRRVLSTPPNGAKTPMDHSPVFLAGDIADDCAVGDQKPSPLMTVTMEGNAVVMFDGGGGSRGLGLTDSDNPSSAHSMDDILLSQLDAASYPEDYEKLKRIANEVAESVSQYCNLDQNSLGSPASTGIYISAHLATGDSLVPNSILSPSHHHHHHHHASLSPILTTSQSTSKSNAVKKYGKKQSGGGGSGGGGGNGANKSAHNSHQLQSNGVRKERSLHYCNICSKGFKDKYSVNVHIRTHTGEKPFACSLCGKSFRQKAHLAKHYQTHMAQKTANTNGVAKPGPNKGRYNSAKPS